MTRVPLFTPISLTNNVHRSYVTKNLYEGVGVGVDSKMAIICFKRRAEQCVINKAEGSKCILVTSNF